jgi:hypothetical protein
MQNSRTTTNRPRENSKPPCPDGCFNREERWHRVPSKKRPGEHEIRCKFCDKFIGYERKR